MLTFKPKGRPSMRAVMSHPFWWSSHQRLSFLIDMSDRMENEDREVGRPSNMSPYCCCLVILGSFWGLKSFQERAAPPLLCRHVSMLFI